MIGAIRRGEERSIFRIGCFREAKWKRERRHHHGHQKNLARSTSSKRHYIS
jgi:hypothetical protein